MKKFLFSAIAIASAFQLSAYTEETEMMTVNFKDGSTVNINVADISQLSFDVVTTNVALEITPATGEKTKYEAIPTMFLMQPATVGESYALGFGTVSAETPEGLTSGDYGVQVAVSASKYNTGEINIADGGVNVTLYQYDENGAVAQSWDAPAQGTVSTRSNKGRLTFELNVSFDDGTTVIASYTGSVTSAESLEAMNPAPVFNNEFQYFNADGSLAMSGKLVECTRKSVSTRGFQMERLILLNEDNETAHNITVEINSDLFDQLLGTEIDMPTAADDAINFKYGSIQLSGPNTTYGNIATNAKVKITDNGDGTFTIEGDVTNTYKYSWGSEGGTPERIVFNFTGALTQL